MQFELRITGDDVPELARLLARLNDARSMIVETVEARPVRGVDHIPPSANGEGLPLTQAAFDVAARASQANAAPPPAAPAPTAPKARGRPRKEVNVSVVNGPDGEPVAVMTEPGSDATDAVDEPVDDVVETPNFPTIKDDPLPPSEMRDKAIAILQSVFGKPQGPVEVRSLQTKFKIKKFNEVPDTMCKDLLTAAQDLHARIMATQG